MQAKQLSTWLHMGGCQNYGPFLGTLNIRCRIILRTHKRDPILENCPYARAMEASLVLLLFPPMAGNWPRVGLGFRGLAGFPG